MRRREFVALGGAAGLAACTTSGGEYFGNTTPPSSSTLIHSLGGEPDTLDPAKSTGGMEFWVIPALLEGLTQYHPRLPQPMAALATHYEPSPAQDQFTFYLRGHENPRGVPLPGFESLPNEFTRGQKSAPDSIPARWSDGPIITAHDFVYSWRRLLDPATAAPMAYQFYHLNNAEDVNTGKRAPEALGVRALDDFTFQVDLRSATPFFLELISQYITAAVPRHAIEAAQRRGSEGSWTEPGHMVASGPFRLRSWRKYESIATVRNPAYYDAVVVGIEALTFVPVVDGSAAVNLYRAGAVASMPGPSFPPLFRPVLATKKDFHTEPAFATCCPAISVPKPPFDNVLLRYALAMATDRKRIAASVGAGCRPASQVVAPIPGYPELGSLPVQIDGQEFDVLSFNPEAGRELLSKAGFGGGMRDGRQLEVLYHFPVLPETKLKAEIIQQQWQRHLGVRVPLMVREFGVHWNMVLEGAYTGVADFAFLPTYFDPNPFLDAFVSPGNGNPSGWTDPTFTSMLADANRTVDRRHRLDMLAGCEKQLLRAMPILPLYSDVWAFLQKPFVRGLTSNLFDIRAFKYAWIDPNWRAA